MSELGNWRELTEGVFVAVGEPATVNFGLIVGSEQALIVDTGSSPAQGRQLRQAVARVTDRPLRGAVVTHWHYDHAFGLAAFSDLETIGHESVAARLQHREWEQQAPRLALTATDLALPGRTIAVATALDLGSRRVEIAHLGLGHTDGDLVVVVPDADLLFVGDLVESAGPPWYGNDSYPDEWPATLDGVIGLMATTSQAVPGHGDPVDRMFVFQQRGEIAAVAAEIHRLAESGVAESEAVGRGSWPFPEINVSAAVTRGYRALRTLPGKERRANLPLV
jgi:glyoxylase-like metal-dependent hydrolase (beta-lactamase superfamily II)